VVRIFCRWALEQAHVRGPLFIPGRIPALCAGGVKVRITVTPDAHAHLLLPTINGVPVIHAVT
jgi:hypothetical protein